MNLNIHSNLVSKMKSCKWLVILILMIFTTISLDAQVPLSQADVQAQLQAKGVSQEEVDEFLLDRGLSYSDLGRLSPEEYLEIDREFEEYIAKKKEEKTLKQQAPVKKPKTNSKVVLEEEPISVIDTIKEIINENSEIGRYGEQLFKGNSFKLQDGEGSVPGTYVLDVGDEVAISIFGNSQMSGVYPIGSDGSIQYAKGQRRVVVAGMTLNEAKEKLEIVFKRFYNFRPGQFNVNVIGARTISLNVYGEVRKSGGYLLSAVNSPLNVIANAGGLTKQGSYRNIRLFKSNGKVEKIDLYNYLSSDNTFQGVSLSNEDVLHIPIAKDIIKLDGAVVLPMEFEIKENETLGDVIDFAGGFQANANQKSIQIIRYANEERKIIDLDFSQNGKNFKLANGDLIQVNILASLVENLIGARGQINNEGDFELRSNMRLSDLIEKLSFNKNTRTDLALLKRKENDGSTKLIKVNIDEIIKDKNIAANILLQNNDELLIWSLERFKDTKSNVVINGAVKFPGKYPYDDEGVYINDIILFAGGLRRDASNVGVIYRKDPLNPNKIQYIRFNPIKETNQAEGEILMPFDSIIVLQDRSLTNNYTVEIAGMVKSPGDFQYGEGMSVKDLIVLADGFNLSALTERVEVNRVIIENNKSTVVKVATVNVDPDLAGSSEGADYILQPFDKVFVRAVPEFELQNVVVLSGAVKYPGKYVLENKNEKLKSVIERAGGLTDEAFMEGAQLERRENNIGQVIMNLKEVYQTSRSKYNYILKNNDIIIIPKKEDIVTLQSNTLFKRITTLANENGEVDNTISIAFFPGKRADYYINKFGGGFGETSDRKSVFVEHANGEVARSKNYLLFRQYPKVRKGSTIVIPEKPVELADNGEEDKVDWTKLLNDSVAQAMSILTLLLLVERI